MYRKQINNYLQDKDDIVGNNSNSTYIDIDEVKNVLDDIESRVEEIKDILDTIQGLSEIDETKDLLKSLKNDLY